MIKLKAPLNYRGVLIEKDSIIGYLPVELQEKLIKSGAAERFIPKVAKEEKSVDEKPIDKMTKSELLEFATKLGIQDVSEQNTKAEIIKAIADLQQGKKEDPEEDASQQEDQESPEDDTSQQGEQEGPEEVDG